MMAHPEGDRYLCRWIDATGGPCELECERGELFMVKLESIPPAAKSTKPKIVPLPKGE